MDDSISSTSLKVSLFSLRHTFESAQPLTFHADYDQFSNTITYPSGRNVINMGHYGSEKDGEVRIVSRDISSAASDVSRRFRLGDDMKAVYKGIGTDQFMKDAITRYSGMRLTLNDPWETTLVFIISQFNNVKRIRLITKNIIARFGPEIMDGSGKSIMRGFPGSADLIGASEKDFRKCGAGFRAKYLKDLADYCTNNIDLNRLNPKNYDKLKETLMSINGVGEKVADCIILMGYGNLAAFPIDVWVKRTIEKAYFNGKRKRMKEIMDFVSQKWDRRYLGYAQQYIFWGGRQASRNEVK
jgi:N-glycosylase/DNA lyase